MINTKLIRRVLFLSYLIYLFLLLLFSYTQVDLNLTLSSQSFYQQIQQKLIYIGYFQRPLSSFILFLFLSASFLFLFIFSFFYKKKIINFDLIKKLILLTGLVLILSYPMFSHDLFNYIFDARIFTKYGLNPYEFRALDFPQDTWIRFMHWIHRTNPYPLVWTTYSLIPSFLGGQIFLPTFFLFKFFVGFLPYIWACWLVYKIADKLFNSKKEEILIYFAFSPVVIFDVLINSHNDLLMMVVALLAFLLIIKQKKILSLVALLLSVFLKYATIVLLPVFSMKLLIKKINFKKIILLASLALFSIIIFYSLKNEFQSWYLLWSFPFFVFLIDNNFWKRLGIFLQMTVLSFYLPFFYFGNWDFSIKRTKTIIILISLLIFSVNVFIKKISNKSRF